MTTDETSLTQYIEPDQLKTDIAIDPANLTAGMTTHASLYTHYAIQAVRAQRQYDRWKVALEILEAQLDSAARVAATEEGRKTTENGIKSIIANDSRWKMCQARVVEAKQMKELCDAALMCFVHRKDMLLQLARDAAAERQGELRISARTEATEATRERLLDMMGKQARTGGLSPR